MLRARGHEVVQFDGPVLELQTDVARAAATSASRRSGPDILAPGWGDEDERRFLRRLREDDPTRPIGDALLDQRTIAGIGNLWKVEGCFEAAIDPWRPTGRVSDEEALRDRGRDAAADAALRARRQPDALQGDLRPPRPALPAVRHARSRSAGRATTTARRSGARAASVSGADGDARC